MFWIPQKYFPKANEKIIKMHSNFFKFHRFVKNSYLMPLSGQVYSCSYVSPDHADHIALKAKTFFFPSHYFFLLQAYMPTWYKYQIKIALVDYILNCRSHFPIFTYIPSLRSGTHEGSGTGFNSFLPCNWESLRSVCVGWIIQDIQQLHIIY